MKKLEQRTEEAESRISATEDDDGRVLRHLMRCEAALTNMCDDLQNRMRRNILRIYQVSEGSEKHDMAGFLKQLIKTTLWFPQENIQINWAKDLWD